ncbi:MAG: hypothetical protein JW803_01600 [Endomicrobiales bacterium]|nr:hypothetical protein [Endomicrobiales bacterium]
MKKAVVIAIVALIVLAAAGAAWSFRTIYSHVADISAQASAEFGAPAADALMMTLQDETRPFRERNRAVWALGQLADRKALPVLKKYYTGDIPEKEPLDKVLSQYELAKAIKWCEKGNATSWMYKDLR